MVDLADNMSKTKVYIEWNTTDEEHPKGQDVKLPHSVVMPKYVMSEYYISHKNISVITDYLSDRFGWLMNTISFKNWRKNG